LPHAGAPTAAKRPSQTLNVSETAQVVPLKTQITALIEYLP
jgi:hypothetical protein